MASTQSIADDEFLASHGGLDQASLAIAVSLLPSQSLASSSMIWWSVHRHCHSIQPPSCVAGSPPLASPRSRCPNTLAAHLALRRPPAIDLVRRKPDRERGPLAKIGFVGHPVPYPTRRLANVVTMGFIVFERHGTNSIVENAANVTYRLTTRTSNSADRRNNAAIKALSFSSTIRRLIVRL